MRSIIFDICPCSATTNFKQWDFWNSEIFTEHRRSILNLENYYINTLLWNIMTTLELLRTVHVIFTAHDIARRVGIKEH